jgi:hypothetical protein
MIEKKKYFPHVIKETLDITKNKFRIIPNIISEKEILIITTDALVFPLLTL